MYAAGYLVTIIALPVTYIEEQVSDEQCKAGPGMNHEHSATLALSTGRQKLE